MEKLVMFAAKWRRNKFIMVVKRTLESIFPFVWIGCIAKIIQLSFFSKEGYFNELFNISEWLPHFNAYSYSFQSLAAMTFGIVAVLAAYQSAKMTARLYKGDASMAGLTGIVSFMLLSAQYIKAPFFQVNFNAFGYDRLLIGLIVGVTVGWIFAKFGGAKIDEMEEGLSAQFFRSFKPILIALVLSFLLNKLLIYIDYLIPENLSSVFGSLGQSDSILATLGYSLLTTLCSWLGIGVEAPKLEPNTQNISYALSHSLNQTMPHPFDCYTLYSGYALIAGLGLTLAFILVSKQNSERKVAKMNVVPALFNSSQSLMVGIPLILNPLYLIPLLLVPILNMFLAAIAIAIHLVPTGVYPIPAGTVSLFIPFMQTNCHWLTIVLVLALLVIDVFCFIPFVRLSNKIDDRVKELEGVEHA